MSLGRHEKKTWKREYDVDPDELQGHEEFTEKKKE